MPQRRKIGRYRGCLHPIVQLYEDRYTGGLVSGLQSPREWPVVFHIAAGAANSPQRILEPTSVVGALMNLDIRHQAEQRTSPIGAAPCVSVVQASIAGGRQSFGKAVHEFAPDCLRRKVADLGARDRLDVSGDPFLDPVVLVWNRRQCEMDHFMRHYPVVPQTGFSSEPR